MLRDLLSDASDRAAAYLEGLQRRAVAGAPFDPAPLAELPEAPTDPAEVLALLDRHVSPSTVASAGGRYFGFVTGSVLPAALAADYLAGAWDQNGALAVMSPPMADLEEIVLGWLTDLLRLPTTTVGGFVTGATMANLTALAAARHALLARLGWDVEASGLAGAPALRVVVGDEVHVSLLKALAILGLGRDRVERVPVDEQGRMLPAHLPAMDERTLLCLQAGNVNTGASDPFPDLVAAARRDGAWVHVDGAFGLWAAVSPELAGQVEGVEEADSWATDAHKWLNVRYDSGIAFVREATALAGAMGSSAAYLAQDERRQPMQYVPEMSRRARAVEIWAALRSLGRAGLAEMVERCCRHARAFAEGLTAAGFEVLNEVVLNQVLVSFGESDRTDRVIEAVQEDGTCWCGGTTWQGRRAMRISVSSWRTTDDDVARSLEAIVSAANG